MKNFYAFFFIVINLLHVSVKAMSEEGIDYGVILNPEADEKEWIRAEFAFKKESVVIKLNKAHFVFKEGIGLSRSSIDGHRARSFAQTLNKDLSFVRKILPDFAKEAHLRIWKKKDSFLVSIYEPTGKLIDRIKINEGRSS